MLQLLRVFAVLPLDEHQRISVLCEQYMVCPVGFEAFLQISARTLVHVSCLGRFRHSHSQEREPASGPDTRPRREHSAELLTNREIFLVGTSVSPSDRSLTARSYCLSLTLALCFLRMVLTQVGKEGSGYTLSEGGT